MTKRFLTTWAVAAAILGATSAAVASPTFFGRTSISGIQDCVQSPPQSGAPPSRLWNRPDQAAFGERELAAWEGILGPTFGPDTSSFEPILGVLAEGRSFASPPDVYPDELGWRIYRSPHDAPEVTDSSLLDGENDIDAYFAGTGLIVRCSVLNDCDIVWDDTEVAGEAGRVDFFSDGDAVETILPACTILLTGIAAGVIGWRGTRRMLPPAHMSDIQQSS